MVICQGFAGSAAIEDDAPFKEEKLIGGILTITMGRDLIDFDRLLEEAEKRFALEVPDLNLIDEGIRAAFKEEEFLPAKAVISELDQLVLKHKSAMLLSVSMNRLREEKGRPIDEQRFVKTLRSVSD